MRRSRSWMRTFPSSGSPPCCRAGRRRRWCDARVRSRGSSRGTTCSTSSPESTDADRGDHGRCDGGARGRGHTVRVVDTVTGLLSPTDEQRLLTTAVGREPPAVAELDGRERAMLSNGLAGLKEVTGADVLFLCLHAGRGEGGILQAVLDVIAVPYTGSGALASALAMDKDLAKRLFRAAGVPVPAWFMAPVAPEDVTTALGWPVIVKPSKMGSSVGMTLVRNPEGLDAAVEVARAFDT